MTIPAGMPEWMKLYEPAPAHVPTYGLLPPQDRELNHAAEALMAIMCDDAFAALVVMCRRKRVARAVRVLLTELCRARLHLIVGIPGK